MRTVRRLSLLAGAALAATVFAAATALGQIEEAHETLEVTDEVTTDHCPAVNANPAVSSGCLLHATSEGSVELRKHVFGIESHITNCNTETWGRVNEDAEGYIFHQLLTGASCQRQPCKVSGVSTPWPGHGDEAHNPTLDRGETGVSSIEGTEVGEFVFCVEPLGGGSDESCEIEGPGNGILAVSHQGEGGHVTEIPGHGIGGFRCEIIGHGQTESTEGFLENNNTKQKEDIAEGSHIPSEDEAEVS